MKMVACGWRHTIVVSDSGSIFTFGWSKYGQLGHGDFQDQLLPRDVQALRNRKIESVCPQFKPQTQTPNQMRHISNSSPSSKTNSNNIFSTQSSRFTLNQQSTITWNSTRTKHGVANSIFCSIVYSCKDLKS
jgi:alpha-tubulin suppressor-like RCC1 family protein